MVLINEGTKKFFSIIKHSINENLIHLKDEQVIIYFIYNKHCTLKGNTSLHWACLLGQLEVVKILIKKGIKINEMNNKGLTPLHYACSKVSGLLILYKI